MREDSLGVDSFARVGDELYAISGKLLYAMQGTVGEPEPFVSWRAETGILYYQYPDKNISRASTYARRWRRGRRWTYTSVRLLREYGSARAG